LLYGHKPQKHCFRVIEVLVKFANKRDIEIEPMFTDWCDERSWLPYFVHKDEPTRRHPLATSILIGVLAALEIVSFYLLWLKAG
jgi:hypothetical protein